MKIVNFLHRCFLSLFPGSLFIFHFYISRFIPHLFFPFVYQITGSSCKLQVTGTHPAESSYLIRFKAGLGVAFQDLMSIQTEHLLQNVSFLPHSLSPFFYSFHLSRFIHSCYTILDLSDISRMVLVILLKSRLLV